MKNLYQFLFCLICLFSFDIVFAANEIVVKSITPVYDEKDSVVVDDNGVIFNDKNQKVQYNVVLENTTDGDFMIDDFQFSQLSEDFILYEVENVEEDKIIKAMDTKEIVISLSTVAKDGWGRNFNDDLTVNFTFDKIVKTEDSSVFTDNMDDGLNDSSEVINNPFTSSKDIIFVLIFMFLITIMLILFVKNKKVSRYMLLVLFLSSIFSISNAKDAIMLSVKINVGFKSQNIMKPTDCIVSTSGSASNCGAYWDYSQLIENFYIENEMNQINNYVQKFDMSLEQNNRIVAYLVLKEEGPYTCMKIEDRKRVEYECDHYDVYLQADGLIYANSDASYYFYDMTILNSLNNLKGLDVSNVTDMRYFFRNTGMNSSIFELDVSSFDTSNVVDMSYLFYNAGKSSERFSLNVENFDTSKVTNMKYMFGYVGYSNPEIQIDLSSFDTSNVVDMSGMFYCFGYKMPVFELDVSNFDTSKVTSMSSMFSCSGFDSIEYNLDLSNFDTSNVSTMYNMFYKAGYDSLNFSIDISNFDTSNVVDMGGMFYGAAYSHNKELSLDLSHFKTSKVTEMNLMFDRFGYNAPKLRIDVSSFDTSNVTDMSFMFSETGYNSSDFELDLRCFDTSKVKVMAAMFSYTAKMNPNFKLYLKDNFDISAATNLNGTFEGLGYSSGNINISVLVSKPTATTYQRVFTNAAIASGSKITVNYTSESSALVDKLIAIKSGKSNVVKGVQID